MSSSVLSSSSTATAKAGAAAAAAAVGGGGRPPPPPPGVGGAGGLVVRGAGSEGKGGMSSSSSPASSSGKWKRVPDSQRRRAAVSCDLCKHRRARCIRASPHEACSNCVSNRVKCESTLPRKQRVYGSVESLSLRYRALEALIRGLLPNENTQDLDTLYRVAAERGISMPSRKDMSPASDIFAAGPPQGGSGSVSTASASSLTPTMADPEAALPTTAPLGLPSPLLERKGSATSGWVVEERLIPSPHGVAHYVGPSSSFKFVASIRGLVAQCNVPLDLSQKALRAAFLELSTSKAMEDPEPCEEDESEPARPGALQPPGRRHAPLERGLHPPKVLEETLRSPGFFPRRETADLFVGLFFERIHPYYQLFHRSTFRPRYEALWQQLQPPDGSECESLDRSWMCCLAMIFAFGAQAMEEHDEVGAMSFQKRYLSFVRASVGRLTGTTSLLNVQALLLLQLYEHNAGQRNTSWMFLGCAARMAMALGMHREGANADYDAIEKDTRRRVWWTLYNSERNLGIILGRPSAIDDGEVTTRPQQELVAPDMLPSHMDCMVQLVRLSWRIKEIVYPIPTEGDVDPAVPPPATARVLLQELEAASHSLPPYLQSEWWKSMIPQHQRAVLMLHLQYQYAVALVTRNYLLHKARVDLGLAPAVAPMRPSLSNSSSPQLSPWAEEVASIADVCLSSAEHTLDCLIQLSDYNILDGVVCSDVYYLYHAILIVCLDVLAQPGGMPMPPDRARRKAKVRSLLHATQYLHVSPTYRIIILVARQFAGIVGAVDSPVNNNSHRHTNNNNNNNNNNGHNSHHGGAAIPYTTPDVPAKPPIYCPVPVATAVATNTALAAPLPPPPPPRPQQQPQQTDHTTVPTTQQLYEQPQRQPYIVANWLPPDISALYCDSLDMGAYEMPFPSRSFLGSSVPPFMAHPGETVQAQQQQQQPPPGGGPGGSGGGAPRAGGPGGPSPPGAEVSMGLTGAGAFGTLPAIHNSSGWAMQQAWRELGLGRYPE